MSSSSRLDAQSALFGHHLSVGFTNRGARGWGVDFSELDFEEDTLPYVHRVDHPLVTALMLQAAEVDKSEDQPYMPFPFTSLEEAANHLSNHGSLGIQGAIMTWDESANQIYLRVIGTAGKVVINWQEAANLLRVNYPKEVQR